MKKVIPKDSVLVPNDAKLVFSGKIFNVYQWPQAMFDGSQHTFEMLKRTDTVNAICIVDNKIIVLDDEQPHLGARLSFPGGRVDDSDESIEASVRREIHEETGYSFNNWRLIKVYQPYRKIEWFVYAWLAWDVSGRDEPHLDPGEKIIARELTFDQLKTTVMAATDYLSESRDIFDKINSIDELTQLPEFEGQEIDS